MTKRKTLIDTPTKNQSSKKTAVAVDSNLTSTDKGVTEGETPEADEKPRGICIVIPFLESAAKADELRYAIRAWEKNLPNVEIILIGDKPAWASDNVLHIPHKPNQSNPQVDVAQKLLLACESDLVSDYFIVSNDDIYPVCPISLTYLDLPTANGPLGQKGTAGGTYRKNSDRTLSALKKAGIAKPWDYGTHTPTGFWKSELREVIQQFSADKEGYLISTLYGNLVWSGIRPIIVDNGEKPNHEGTRTYVGSAYKVIAPGVMQKAFDERVFINSNDHGWTSVLPFLKKQFPDKSKFEN